MKSPPYPVIEFPLRGEWQAETSPATKIPSHGTNRLGLRYAFDFWQIDWQLKHRPFFQGSSFKSFFLGTPLKDCYCWGQPIYAPADGQIIVAVDGVAERKIAHWLFDSLLALKNALFFNEAKEDYRKIAGNYLMLQSEEKVVMLFAHLQLHSLAVTPGTSVKKGDFLGRVGHSGNSTAPHLHFQLMDRSDIAHAKGLPFVFAQYELYEKGQWVPITNQIPDKEDRFRFIP